MALRFLTYVWSVRTGLKPFPSGPFRDAPSLVKVSTSLGSELDPILSSDPRVLRLMAPKLLMGPAETLR